MKFPKTWIKSTETQFENAKTQFQKCENSIYRGPTGVDWPRNALKKSPATPLEGVDCPSFNYFYLYQL